MTDLYQHIGTKIRDLRREYPKGALSQEALASKLEVASNTISRWETGTYKPTPEDLDKLAKSVIANVEKSSGGVLRG